MESDALESAYEVLVIGGGAAGLSAALMLGRGRRSVAVIDAGEPRNRPAEGVHGLLGHEGISPEELLQRGRREVRAYGGKVVAGEVVDAFREGAGFRVRLADGRATGARQLLVTTGLIDELPDVPGLRERWGRDVIHCPWCHGWEVRDKAIGVVASGPMSTHQALLFRQWSPDIVYFTDVPAPLTKEQAEQLAARGIRVIQGKLNSVEIVDDRVVGLRMADGTMVERSALVVATRMVARAGFLDKLGLQAVEHSAGIGAFVPVDAAGRTSVPGVWAAGNVTDLSAQVGASAAAGALAATQISADLMIEEVSAAVAEYRATSGASPAPAG